jgi:GTP cyclohydrolase I
VSRARRSSRRAAAGDALADAVAAMIDATGLDPRHKDLVDTPSRVAKQWRELFLAGLAMDPAKILGEPVTGEGETELVIVRDLPMCGMCPHHLLPYTGRATVAYLPSDRLVGFGRLADLVSCYTRRFTLQERACNDVADALMVHLRARGAACVMVGDHACLRVVDHKHAAQVVTASFRGALADDPELRARLLA